MELQAIMDELRMLTPGHFPEAAVKAATTHREEITPRLLEVLEQTAADPDSLADPEFTLPLHALYLLAQFREPRAWPVILRLFGQTGEAGEDISAYTGDFVPQDLPRVLASVYDGDLAPLLAIITNPDCDEWARGACVCTLAYLAAGERLPLAEAEAVFRNLLNGGLEREIKEGQEGNVWESLASSCCDLRLTGLQDEILRACDEGLIFPGYITPKEIRGDMRRPLNLKELREAYAVPVTDAAAEMREWPCFTDPEWGTYEPEEEQKAEAAVPAQREEPKVGRNAPCPCGSGRKYKKCCGA